MTNELGAYPQRRARLVPAWRRLTGNPGGMLLAAMLVVTSAAAETAGERIASKGASQPGAVACASCHGPDGGGNEQAGFPRLAGLDAAYIESQLRAYQQGQRKNPVMAGMAAPLTDQDIKDVPGTFVPFFGLPAWTPTGAAMFSIRMNSPVVPGFIHRLPNGKHIAEFHPPLPTPTDGSTEDRIEELTATATAKIEDQIRAHPEQWVWMHRRWRRQPETLER